MVSTSSPASGSPSRLISCHNYIRRLNDGLGSITRPQIQIFSRGFGDYRCYLQAWRNLNDHFSSDQARKNGLECTLKYIATLIFMNKEFQKRISKNANLSFSKSNQRFLPVLAAETKHIKIVQAVV